MILTGQTAFAYGSQRNGETALLNNPYPGVEWSNRFFSEDAVVKTQLLLTSLKLNGHDGFTCPITSTMIIRLIIYNKTSAYTCL